MGNCGSEWCKWRHAHGRPWFPNAANNVQTQVGRWGTKPLGKGGGNTGHRSIYVSNIYKIRSRYYLHFYIGTCIYIYYIYICIYQIIIRSDISFSISHKISKHIPTNYGCLPTLHHLSLPQQLSEGPFLWHRTCAGALVRVRVVRVRVVVRLLRGLRVVLAMAWVDVGLTLGSGRLPSSTRQPYRNGQNHYGKS